MKNYYDILSLKRDSSADEVAESYNKMVLRWHPKFAKEDQKTSFHHFSEISEAYEVLSDPLKRTFYDKYGYHKLKEGLFSEGELKGGYRFADNPDQIFEKFYRSHNNLAKTVNTEIIERGSLFSHAFGGLNYSASHILEDLIVEVPCNLHELYKGVAKSVTFYRIVLNLDGKTTSAKEESLLLEIKPGYSKNTLLTFVNQGHQDVQRHTSNLIIKIVEITHQNYSRKDNDLIYSTDITLAEALSCKNVEIRTLDNRSVKVGIDEIITPNQLKHVEGEGMPYIQSDGRSAKGDLYIKFNIHFPQQLEQSSRIQIRKLLS